MSGPAECLGTVLPASGRAFLAGVLAEARPGSTASVSSSASRGRAALRAAAIVAATVGTLIALAWLRLRRGLRADRGGAEADRLGRHWARTLQRCMDLRIVVEGEPPEGPVAIVANHLGYLDVVALWCVVPGVFVARADVARWPLVGLASRLIGTIFLDRARKRDLLRVVPELSEALAAGRNVVFFPEGTSSPGAEVLPFRSSLFEAAARRVVPVVGVSLQYETPAPGPEASLAVCWWGDMTFLRHVGALLALPHVVVRIRFSAPIPPSGDRKALCRLAREAVVERFVPTPSLPAGAKVHSNAEGRGDAMRGMERREGSEHLGRIPASRDCIRLLEQGRALVAELTADQYGARFDDGAFASTGAHLRHVIDYLDCLLAGVDARSIDYTARRRALEVETSREAGQRELARCIEALEKLDPRRERLAVDVRCDEGDPWVASTLARELHFVASHTVHHFALIRLTLARCGRTTAAEFGVSPSTLAYRGRRGSQQ